MSLAASNPAAELEGLRTERARLISLLEAHGIEWRLPPKAVEPVGEPEPSTLSTDEKVTLFRRLFRGRTDLCPVRWENSTTGKSGYSPVCANDRRPGICEKPRIKCADCNHRQMKPLSDQVIYEHLAGNRTVGVYPLLTDDTCHFLAADFDEAEWREDAKAFFQSCLELGVPAALEISRSGNGAHAWIFFTGSVSARDARRLGTAIISHTCARTGGGWHSGCVPAPRQRSVTDGCDCAENRNCVPAGPEGARSDRAHRASRCHRGCNGWQSDRTDCFAWPDYEETSRRLDYGT